MSPEVLLPVFVSVAGSALVCWGGYRFFSGRMVEWRGSVTKELEEVVRRLERHIDKDEEEHKKLAVLDSNFTRCTKDVQDLRDFKHAKIDPYIGALDAIKPRVDRIERFLNGKLDEYRRRHQSDIGS